MVSGQQIVDQAQQAAAARSPYLFGGNPYAGSTWAQFKSDCSGLIDRIFANLGQPLPGRPTTTDLVKLGQPVTGGLGNAQPGDLLFFNGNQHVGVYVGNNQMIDDPSTGQTVKQEAVYAIPDAIRRVSTPTTGSGSAQPGSVLAAIEAATSDADTRLAMSLGALLEGGSLGAGPFPTGDHGQSPGPYQIRLYDNSGAPVHGNQISRAQAQDPTTATQFMLADYQAAVAKVGHASFVANPERAAEQAAYLAERPAQDYYASRGTSAVHSAYQSATAGLAVAPSSSTGGMTVSPASWYDPRTWPGDAANATGTAIENVLKDVTKPLVHFIENAWLVGIGVIAVIIGVILLATSGDSGSGGSGGVGGGGGGGGGSPAAQAEKEPGAEEAEVAE